MPPNLVLVRHGQSTWNADNRFTGWIDVDLTDQGRDEAHEAGRQIQEAGLTFDIAYTSLLKRAVHTLWILLDELDAVWPSPGSSPQVCTMDCSAAFTTSSISMPCKPIGPPW